MTLGRRATALLLLGLGLASPGAAEVLALQYGQDGREVSIGLWADHIEFLLAHGWEPIRASELQVSPPSLQGALQRPLPPRALLVTFDEAVFGILARIVPFLDLYELPITVAVSAATLRDQPAAILQLASSPWVDVVPLAPPVERPHGELRCAGGRVEASTSSQVSSIEGWRRELSDLMAAVAEVVGARPTVLAWPADSLFAEVEKEAEALGIKVQLAVAPRSLRPLRPPRVGRFPVSPGTGVGELVLASLSFTFEAHPVRFLELDPDWLCAQGDLDQRMERAGTVIRQLGLNAVRLPSVSTDGEAYFPTDQLPSRGNVLAAVLERLDGYGNLRFRVVDLPEGANEVLTRHLARAVAAEVVVAADGTGLDEVTDAVRQGMPGVIFGVRGEPVPAGALRFRSIPARDAPALTLLPPRGERLAVTVVRNRGTSLQRLNRAALSWSAAGFTWIGVRLDSLDGVAGPFGALVPDLGLRSHPLEPWSE